MKTEDIWVGFFAVVFGGAGVIVFATAVVLVRGWALSLVWNWYAVPFAHVAHLSIPMAIGMSTLIGLVYSRRVEKNRKVSEILGEVFLGPVVAVVVAWVARWWL